jgi:hypothetical protein
MRLARWPHMPAVRFASFVLCLVAARTALADSGAPRAAPESTAAFPSAIPTRDTSAQQEPEGPAPVPAPPTSDAIAYPPSQSAEPDTQPTFPEAPPDKTRQRTHWYGGQTLAVDGASVGLLLVAAGTDAPVVAGIAAFGYALGPPIVHFTHGRVAAGFGSLALRVGLPLLGGSLGASAATCHAEEIYCGLAEAGVGILIGISAAITIDAAVLARETVTVEEPAPMSALRLVPVFEPHRGTAGLGVAGSF